MSRGRCFVVSPGFGRRILVKCIGIRRYPLCACVYVCIHLRVNMLRNETQERVANLDTRETIARFGNDVRIVNIE